MISPEAEIPYADFVIESWIANDPASGGRSDAAIDCRELLQRVAPAVRERRFETRLVLFVASDEASFSTGSEFIADGGALLGPVPDANS